MSERNMGKNSKTCIYHYKRKKKKSNFCNIQNDTEALPGYVNQSNTHVIGSAWGLLRAGRMLPRNYQALVNLIVVRHTADYMITVRWIYHLCHLILVKLTFTQNKWLKGFLQANHRLKMLPVPKWQSWYFILLLK